MNMDILLSVIVPVYNVKDYLEMCLESICKQTYTSLEIILVDDGSTDGSEGICDDYAKKDARIKVVHKENGGQISARKVGVNIASGDYIISVDSDDWIEKDRFKNLVEKGLVQAPDMVYLAGMYKDYKDKSVCISGFEEINGVYEKNDIRTRLMTFSVGNGLYLERRMEFSHWSWCVRADIYKRNLFKIDERIRRIEDFISIFSCMLDSNKIVCINELSYHYIQREGSINAKKTNWNENHANIYYAQMKEILERYAEEIPQETLNVAIQYMYHNIFLTNYKKLYDYYTDYLFPYAPVKIGSKLIVYGAGNIGVEMVNAIDSGFKYRLVAWVDKNPKTNPRSKHKVEPIDVIEEREYDYIVVAILISYTAVAVKTELIQRGVPEEKIVLMSAKKMCMEDLDKILGE